MSYNLLVSQVGQTARLVYTCSVDTPAMLTAGTAREFQPDQVSVNLSRRESQQLHALGGHAWWVVRVEVFGWITPAARECPVAGDQRRAVRTFVTHSQSGEVPPAERPVPPWFDTLLGHALRMVSEGATLALPGLADTVAP